MQNDIIAKIDSLVKMSESTNNASTLKVELREIECSIKEKKLDLKELKSSISDDKYFDASGEIVDKNIEISLTKKIKLLKKSLIDLDEQVNEVTKEEEKMFNQLEILKSMIYDSENFIEVLNTKISSADSEEKNNFKTLLKETETKLKDNKKDLDKKRKAYEKVQGKLEMLCFSKKELENKIDSETEKLIDVKANLANKRGYIDIELRNEDEKSLELLENEITKLEAEKNIILSDPVMIAEEAKNFLIEDDKTSALKKVKELKDLILQLPYMDLGIQSKDSLAIELEKAESKRDEFASMINSKNYESVDTTLIKDRIAYITDKKDTLLKEIETIKEKIKLADIQELEDLNNRINYCENEVSNLEEKLEEYEKTLIDSDLSITKKATLQAAFDKKEEELNNILELLSSYKNDRKNLIIQSFELEKNNIIKLNEEIKNIDLEIKKLEKMCVSSNKAKDIIAMENDKKTLKELNEVVKAIKKRQSLKTTPNELYDEIEILLGTDIDFIDENENSINEEGAKVIEVPEQIVENEIIIDSQESQENSSENIEEFTISNIEEPIEAAPINDIKEVEIEEISIANEPVLNLDITDINNEEKLKVINIERLDSVEEPTIKENNEFLIGDYITEE